MITRDQWKWILIALAGVLLLAFLTNPNQARHLRVIKETGALRYSRDASTTDFLLSVEYHNYFLFSTTSCVGNTVTYGYFGLVQTTNNIGWLYDAPPK